MPGTWPMSLPTVVRAGRGSGKRFAYVALKRGNSDVSAQVDRRLDHVGERRAAGLQDRLDVRDRDVRLLLDRLARDAAGLRVDRPQPVT